MQQLWWVPVASGVVVFSCVSLMVVRAIALRQARSGRASRVLAASSVPASVPVVLAAMAGAATVVLTRAFPVAGIATAGIVAVATLVLFGRDRLKR